MTVFNAQDYLEGIATYAALVEYSIPDLEDDTQRQSVEQELEDTLTGAFRDLSELIDTYRLPIRRIKGVSVAVTARVRS